MSFTNFFYPIFLALICLLYYVCSYQIRWMVLLAASLYFYSCWKLEFLPLMIFCILLNYFTALAIAKSNSKFKRKLFLALAITLSFIPLFIFKYYNFFIDSLVGVGFSITKIEDIILPLGISFYTFQSLSYTLDVYYKRIEVEKNLDKFALFVTFFPHLVAGPIVRASHLLPQFYTKQEFNWDRFKSGMALVIWGFFKKIVIADYLSVFVNGYYIHPENEGAIYAILATYFFAFQIYCDFSGYTDIAIGSARLMGIDLTENFKNPYFAKSVKEFWQRWHITLTSWFKDYLYIPLGGNRVGLFRWVLNIILVFTLSGLWHGANWTYVVWGLAHGLLYLISEALNFHKNTKQNPPNKFLNFIKTICTFNIITLVWIFFRAKTINDALYIFNSIFTTSFLTYGEQFAKIWTDFTRAYLVNFINLGLAFILIAILLLVDYLKSRINIMGKSDLISKIISNILLSLMLVMILLFTQYTTEDFIYFQF